MIKAEYHYKSTPLRSVEIECNEEGLLLVDGLGAQAFFDLLSLKGEDVLDGSCIIGGEDLLDLNNANRDRLPVSVISSSNYSFSVNRTQVPFGGSVDTTDIDLLTKRYIEKERLSPNWSLNFMRLFDAIYSEICAHPKYLLLHLGNADKDFCRAVTGLCEKALKKYPIIIYAHCLTEEMNQEVRFYDDIESVIHPEAQSTYFDETQAEKNLVQTAFLNDLLGTGSVNLDSGDGTFDDSLFGEPEVFPRRAFFQMLAGNVIALISYLPFIFYFAMKKSDLVLYFGAALVFLALSIASGYFGSRLYKEKKYKKFWKNKMLSLFCMVDLGLLLVSLILTIVFGALHGFGANILEYVVTFILMLLNAATLFFYYLFEHRIFVPKDDKNGGQ